MLKYPSIAIVSSFFCLWINSFFNEDFQLILGFLLIFSFGILHGANDLVLILSLKSKQNEISFKKVLFFYVLIVFFGAISFYFFSKIALLIFIIFSGFHFGEQQFQKIETLSRYKLIAFQSIYGLFILFMLFNFHKAEVQNVVYEICNYNIKSVYITSLFYTLLLVLAISGFLIYYMYPNFLSQLLLELFYLLVFAIIFTSSNLIWGFAIYFILWHSIPSIIDQIVFLYGNYSEKNFKKYIKSAFLYWIISLAGLYLMYQLLKEYKLFNSLFFSFLAAITFPHVLVIIKMFEKK